MVAPRFWFILGLLLKSMDLFTTSLIVSLFGIDLEVNPIVRMLFEHLGISISVIINLIIFVIAITVLLKKKYIRTLILVNLIMSVVVINNIYNLILIMMMMS